MKCEYYEGTDETSCKPCIKQGSQCVSQGLPEEHWLSFNHNNSETTLAEGPVVPSEVRRKVDYGIPTPLSIISGPAKPLSFYRHQSSKVRIPDSDIVMIVIGCFHQHHTVENDFLPASQGKYERLSRFLHESLPSREDTERICTASRHPSVLAHEIMTMPCTTLHQNGLGDAGNLTRDA
jgi:hypothetical protein